MRTLDLNDTPNRMGRRLARPPSVRACAIAILVCTAALVAAACGDDDSPTSATASSEVSIPASSVLTESLPYKPSATTPTDDGAVSTISLVGADGDPSARAAFAIAESAMAANNAGDMETWAYWREQDQASAADFAYDLASDSRLDVAQCTYRGLADWDMDVTVRGHGFDCEATQSDLFMRAAGVELEMTHNWVVAEDLASALAGSNEHFPARAQLMQGFRNWLASEYPDAESDITWDQSGFPIPESVLATAEYIDEFVAASDTYPLTEPVPAGGYGGPLDQVG